MDDGYGRIFLLSHMRAYTSLAGHVLGSHPEINGYYEHHLAYEDEESLARQRAAYTAQHALKPGSRWLFDKLLHDEYRLLPQALKSIELRLLVSVRAPQAAVPSIVRLFSAKPGPQPYARVEAAAAYYVQRLETLAAFAVRHRGGYFYFDAESWQAEPHRLLGALSAWIGLSTPLADRYQTFPLTGRPGCGDSSANIFSGRILRTVSPHPPVALPASLRDALCAAHARCRALLRAHAKAALCVDGE